MTTHATPWNPQEILSHLSEDVRQHLGSCTVVEQCCSVMDMATPNTPGIHLCLTESQTHGRGQKGNTWHSPAQCGIWLALQYQPSHSVRTGILPIAMGIMIIQALKMLRAPTMLQVKWPNDLYIQGKKFGGILVETTTQGPQQRITIGIGLTLCAHPTLSTLSGMTDLQSAWPNMPKRLDILIAILATLLPGLATHIDASELPNAFHPHDMLHGRTVTLERPQGRITGVAEGIQDQGALKIRSNDGAQHIVTDGKLIDF